jgi:putative hemolysin
VHALSGDLAFAEVKGDDVMMGDLVLLLVLIMLNAFFAASEAALISVNDYRVRMLAEEGNKKAKKVIRLLDEPSEFLAVIQTGITLAGFLASAFAAHNFSGKISDLIKFMGINLPQKLTNSISVLVVTLILAYITLLFGELVPKRLAISRAEDISMKVAGTINNILKAALPVVKLLTVSTNFVVKLLGVDPEGEEEKITEEEIRILVNVGEEIGAIHETEKKLIDNVFEFNDKVASDIMTVRADILALPVDEGLDRAVAAITKSRFSRIPIYKDSIDSIIGVICAWDVFECVAGGCSREEFALSKIMRPPYFVPESKKIDELIKELIANKRHLAVAVNEFGGTAGIVTVEDLIEEIVGDVYDVNPVRRGFKALSENEFLIDGSQSISSVEGFLGVGIPRGDYGTIGGFISNELGRIPRKGDTVALEKEKLVFEVEEVKSNRVISVKSSIPGEKQKRP